MKKAHRSDFLKAIKTRFPEVRDKLNKANGLLTFEVSVFISLVQEKIDAADAQATRDAFNLLLTFYTDGNTSLKHSIRNVVCEDLNFSSAGRIDRAWALSALPTPLRTERDAWLKFMGYPADTLGH